MDKRYQVFVSSTYEDLQEERQQVMQALLELDCIPSGMELFPAANDDQWTLIKKVIDDCDYYIVIIGGRYGSLAPDGLSFTEKEYRYALENGKPIMAFLHKDPGTLPDKRTEQSPEGKTKLEAFRGLARQKMVRPWSSPADLGSVVSRSVIMLIKNNPAIGWVRADEVPDENVSLEMLRLKKQVEELETQLGTARTKAPEGTQDFAQGNDNHEIVFQFEASVPRSDFDISIDFGHSADKHTEKFTCSWNVIFSTIAPLMINEAREYELFETLTEFIKDNTINHLKTQPAYAGKVLSHFKILETDFHTIKIQLRALGLITQSVKPRSVKNTGTYWTLTPYGDNVMTKLRAIKKPSTVG